MSTIAFDVKLGTRNADFQTRYFFLPMSLPPDSGSDWQQFTDAKSNLVKSNEQDCDLSENDGSESKDDRHDPDYHPESIGRYQIVRQLGSGGFGHVYLANDPDLHRPVAIKVPRWDRPLSESAIARFLKEGKLLAQIDYPSIVSVHDLGLEDGVPFVVMQYVDGKTLARIIRDKKPGLDRSLKILMQIANALREAHKETIVHRDFKPSNVIIDNKNRVHLVDFGMALHDDLTQEDFKNKGAVGTPQFMSPEQIRGENHRIDGRTDIWAFGVTMYLMLSGRQPFRGENKKELTRGVCFRNPRPIRQLNDKVPQELERICMRCLSKLMDERYQSMADLIEEFEQAVGEIQSVAEFSSSSSAFVPEVTVRSNVVPDVPSASHQSDPWTRDSFRSAESNASATSGEPLAYIPKGLRCFDENDCEFFMRLLPGPKDRLGLPESLRFWTSKLGTEGPVEKTPIGIIYGPSGCGKSSFVRAGLLPFISAHVDAVYVDCTSPDLPSLILESTKRIRPDQQADNLPTLIRNLRREQFEKGKSKKILLVLDQFEQWLENCKEYATSDLTSALRQCDGDHIQCLILVRDDYWMSITRFMRGLEQRVSEGRNSMSLPLFDRRHARNVLRSYGRTVGALPAASQALNRKQKRFVRDAVDSITQNGNVLCVHLTILADMLADKDWGASSFDKALGTESIGGVFLERHLNESVRAKKSGWLPLCETIFSELLPTQSDNRIKALNRKETELRDACEIRNEEQFEDCMSFLARDLRLISEVESISSQETLTNQQTSISNDAQDKSYRLTHDFFVAPIRQWITRRRSQSVAGRARVRFDQLSTQYEINKKRRYLPNPLELATFQLFTRNRHRTPKQKAFMKAANRYYAAFCAGLAVLGLTGWFVGFTIWQSQVAQKTRNGLYDAPTIAKATETINRMIENSKWYAPLLKKDSESPSDRIAARSSIALVMMGEDCEYYLRIALLNIGGAANHDFGLYEQAIACAEADVATELIDHAIAKLEDLKSDARLASLQIRFGKSDEAIRLLATTQSPDSRTAFTNAFVHWHAPLDEFIDLVPKDASAEVLFGIFEALTFVDQGSILKYEEEVSAFAKEKYAAATDTGLILMIEHCLRVQNLVLEDVEQRPIDGRRLEWGGTTANMVKLSGGRLVPHQEARAGDEKGPITIGPFSVSSTEVTVGMFWQYVQQLPNDHYTRKLVEQRDWWGDPTYDNTAMTHLSKKHICGYMNWLSKEHGKDHAYREDRSSGEPVFTKIEGANGFRLLTIDEHEWSSLTGIQGLKYSWASENYYHSLSNEEKHEQASMYQTIRQTDGDDETEVENQQDADTVKATIRVDATAPNRFGIYETTGGVREICHGSTGILYLTNGSFTDSLDDIQIGAFLPWPARFTIFPFGFRIACDQ